jgi:hypothetical protein
MASATKGRFCHTRRTITTGTNDEINFHDGTAERTATLRAGTYFLRGDDLFSGESGADSNAWDLLGEIENRMNNAPSSAITDFTVTLAATTGTSRGKVTIASAGGPNFELRWSTGASAQKFDGTWIGFDTSADDTGAQTYTSDNHAPGLWYPEIEGLWFDYDVRRVRTWQEAVSGSVDVRSLSSYAIRTVEYPLIDRSLIKDQFDATNVAFENFWDDAAVGGSFVVFPDVDDTSTAWHCVIDEARWGEELHNAAVPMDEAQGEAYRVVIPMRAYVSAS